MDSDSATQSWARFESGVSDDLLRALCGAFAIVATSDMELAPEEIDRFMSVLKSRSDIFGNLDFEGLETTFRELCAILLNDPIVGRGRALEYVSVVRDNPQDRELVRSAALIALQADNRVERVEETAMRVICIALGIDD